MAFLRLSAFPFSNSILLIGNPWSFLRRYFALQLAEQRSALESFLICLRNLDPQTMHILISFILLLYLQLTADISHDQSAGECDQNEECYSHDHVLYVKQGPQWEVIFRSKRRNIFLLSLFEFVNKVVYIIVLTLRVFKMELSTDRALLITYTASAIEAIMFCSSYLSLVISASILFAIYGLSVW